MSDSLAPRPSLIKRCQHSCYWPESDAGNTNSACSICKATIAPVKADPAVTRRMCAEIAEAERETKEARAQMLRAEAEREEREAAEEEAENAMELNLAIDRTEEAEADAEA
jgi:hypothetical protein